MGIFFESKIVPVKAVNFLPHSQHSKLLIPDSLNPSFANVPPQCGQHFGLIELMSASSSGEGFLCFCSYHSKTVASIMVSVPVLPFSPDHENCRSDVKRGFPFFCFMFLAVGFSTTAMQDRQVKSAAPPWKGHLIARPFSSGVSIITP